MSEQEKPKLPPFSRRHMEYLLICFAKDLMPAEIYPNFRVLFPVFTDDFDDKYIRKLILDRFHDLKRRAKDKISELRETLPEDNYDYIPIGRLDYRLYLMQEIISRHLGIAGEKTGAASLEILASISRQVDLVDKMMGRAGKKEEFVTDEEIKNMGWEDLTSEDDVLSQPIQPNPVGLDEEEDVNTSKAFTEITNQS